MTSDSLNKELIQAVEYFKTRKANKLLKEGADPNTFFNQKGKTVLMEAAHRCDLSMVKTLIEHGAEINTKDREPGFNSLLYACSSGCIQIIKLLQDVGADIHSLANDQSNGLMHAAYNNQYKAIQYFIDQGIDLNAQNDKGQTALIYALNNCIGDYAFMKYEKERKLIKNKKKTVLKLLELGADLNTADKKRQYTLKLYRKTRLLGLYRSFVKAGCRYQCFKKKIFLYRPIKPSEIMKNWKHCLNSTGQNNFPYAFLTN
jgi:hypothetical protein